MAVKKTEDIKEETVDTTSTEYWAEKVKITVPFDPNSDDQSLFVSVNDKRYQIMRGEEVEVPRFVAEVLKQSQEAEKEAFLRRMKMSREYEEEAKKRMG